jgi:hypothetical protein
MTRTSAQSMTDAARPNYGLLRTKDRCPISEFASVRGPARLVIEENRIAAPRSSFAENSARSFAAEADHR